MRIQLCALIVFGIAMFAVVCIRLQGGLVEVKKNKPKLVKNLRKPITKPLTPIISKPLTRKKWDGCAPYTGINRSAALEKLLLSVVNTLDQLNITYTLGFGSLIGVLRDKAINPNEIDNDFIVNRFKLTREIYDIFRANGLHVFLSDVWRVCHAGTRVRNSPWDVKNYIPFTDIYDQNMMFRLFHFQTNLSDIRNITLFGRQIWIPNERDSQRILSRYKNWHIPTFTETHKRIINHMYPNGKPIRQHTAPKRWKAGNDVRYDTVAKIIRAFDDAEIDSFIMAGAALGAHRHHGWMPWDKDSDILVMSTNKAKIDNILQSNNISFKHQRDGTGPGKDGFGYHIYITRSNKYIDLWLFESISANEIQCKGINGGCKRWCNKYTESPMCKPLVKEYFYPVQLVPYGNYLMPCGREAYLDFYYSKSWRTKCRGWVHGKQKCVDFYKTTDFVFHDVDENGYKMEILKQDSKIKHIFTIINGTYTLKPLL